MKTGKWLLLLVFLVVVNHGAAAATSRNPFGWDVSYQKVFDKSEVPANDTMRIFFAQTAKAGKGKLRDAAIPNSLFNGLNKKKIKTAILVDFQAFWFSGKRMVSLYIETADKVYVDLYETRDRKKARRRILEPERWKKLDRFFTGLKQEIPTFEHNLSAPKGFTFSGYIGAVSQYRNGRTNQILLTPEDMLRFDMSPGRVMKVMNRVMGLP